MRDRLSRREFFKGIGVGTLGMSFGVSAIDGIHKYAEALTEGEKHELLMKGTVNFKGFVAKEVTPNDEFYITSYSTTVPEISRETFQLNVEGEVKKPYSLTMDEIEDMKDKTEFVTLECIGNPVGGNAISNALWEGVTLKKVIERAVPEKGIVKTAFFAEDRYSDSIPYALSLSEDVFLAFSMNGEPLPDVHGFPLRAIVPGIYGMKNVKWLSRIELLSYDFKGFWEKRGWSDEAVIPIKSQILMPMDGKTIKPGSYVIGGIAFAGRHGISGVQISLDDGDTWNDTEIKPPISRWAWTLWRYDWKPQDGKTYTIKVRGIDREGKIQEQGSFFRRFTSSFPDGAKGYHTITVKVKG